MENEIDQARLRQKLKRDPKEVEAFLQALIRQSGIEVPDGYDVESAFADLLAIGAVTHDPAVRAPIGRLGLWLFRRLPPSTTGEPHE